MQIRQISVFLQNVPGALRGLTELLGEHDINLLALSLAETESYGLVRLIVKGPRFDEALDLLKTNGYMAKIHSVLCVGVPDRPQGLAQVLRHIEAADVSVEYIYSFCRPLENGALIILRPSQFPECVAALEKAGVRLLSQDEIDRLF